MVTSFFEPDRLFLEEVFHQCLLLSSRALLHFLISALVPRSVRDVLDDCLLP